jgi:Domain of unknown function (DUF4365)
VLDPNNHQGKFGEDYIRVLASAAGLIIYTADLDHDGVDFLLRLPGRRGPAASPGIDVQVKSWSKRRQSDGMWHYDGLNEMQYNLLAGPNYTVPRYLFLVNVPPKADNYATVLTDGLLLRYQAFYTSLRDNELIADPSTRRRRMVEVPVGNVLTVRTLQGLLQPGAAVVGGTR